MGYLARSLSKAGAWRILLGAATRFDRYPSGDDVDTPRAFIEGQFLRPGTDVVLTSFRLSRPAAKDLKCWQNLEGKVIEIPGDEKDSLLTYKALSAHATREVMAGRLVNQILKGSFGWHEYQGKKYNVRTNGCVDEHALYYDKEAPLTVLAPKNALQKLPKRDDITLNGIDGQVLYDLLTFWQENGPRHFPLALLFACARIMLPDIEEAGRVDWQIELFAKTTLMKTAVINYFLAMFFGDYRYNSPTEITDSKQGDTGVGNVYKEGRLWGVAYQDVDYRYKPDHPLYEKYQERRLISLGKTRNKAGGGERGRARGDGSETRPDGGGLLIRTGEVNPYEYSLAQCDDESTDAGACTFLFFGDSNEEKEARRKRSTAIEARRSHLCGIGVKWTQWLAGRSGDDIRQKYQEYQEVADTTIESIVSRHKLRHIHLRVFNWLRDMLAGGRFFLDFLIDSQDIQHTDKLQAYILENINDFVTERLEEAERLALEYQQHRGGATQQESLAHKISETIYQEIHAGRAHWKNSEGTVPTSDDMPEHYHPVPDAGYSEIEAGGGTLRAGGLFLGIVTRDYVYIPSKVFHSFLGKHIKKCPSKLDCLRALEAAGAITPLRDGEKKRYTAQIDGKGPRYIKIAASFIYGDDEEETESPSPQGAELASENEGQAARIGDETETTAASFEEEEGAVPPQDGGASPGPGDDWLDEEDFIE
jgi:hypothetical protein